MIIHERWLPFHSQHIWLAFSLLHVCVLLMVMLKPQGFILMFNTAIEECNTSSTPTGNCFHILGGANLLNYHVARRRCC